MFQLTDLNNFRDAGTDILVFNMVNNNPNLLFQDNLSAGSCFFATEKTSGMPMYVFKEADNYHRISYANVTNIGFFYVTPEFDLWLNNNTFHIFKDVNITLSNGTFQNVYISKKTGTNFNKDVYNNLHPVYTSQWTTTSDNLINNIDVKLLNDISVYEPVSELKIDLTAGTAVLIGTATDQIKTTITGTLEYSKNIIVSGINIFNTEITNIYITKKPGSEILKTEYVLDSTVLQSPFSNSLLTDISDFLNSIPVGEYSIKMNTIWLNSLVETGIVDYHISFSQLHTNSTQTQVIVPNIIYSKSLYENSCPLFDNAILKLEEALVQEQTINNLIKNDPVISQNVENFINLKSTEINDKLNNITNLYNNIQQVVSENNEFIKNSAVLTSTEANELSQKILNLRDKVYSSINLLGNRQNIVYLLSKVQI